MLTVSPQGEEDFVGYDEDDTGIPPVPISARDVAEFGPHWKTIAEALAVAVGFDYDTWESEGHLRRIGSLQDSFGHVRAVLLFMSPGGLGDYHYLFRTLAARFDCTVLVPSGRWITAEIEALGKRNGLTFVNLADRLARTAADPESRIAAGGGSRQVRGRSDRLSVDPRRERPDVGPSPHRGRRKPENHAAGTGTGPGIRLPAQHPGG